MDRDVNYVLTYWVITQMQYLGYCDLVVWLSRFLGWPQPLVIELPTHTVSVSFSFTQALLIEVCNKIPLLVVWWFDLRCTLFRCNFWASCCHFVNNFTSTRSTTFRCAMYRNCWTYTTRDCNFSIIPTSTACNLFFLCYLLLFCYKDFSFTVASRIRTIF